MVLISHIYKLVFIHIPKTGGNFVKQILKKIDPDCLEIFEKEYGHHPFFKIKHLDIYNTIKDYTFFCVIRDPIDLLISHYNYILTCKELHYLYSYINNKSFSESVDLILINNGELNLLYLKENGLPYDKIINPINKDIIRLKFVNIKDELINFLSNLNIEKDILNKIDLSVKVNESNKFVEINNTEIEYLLENNHSLKKVVEDNKFLFS